MFPGTWEVIAFIMVQAGPRKKLKSLPRTYNKKGKEKEKSLGCGSSDKCQSSNHKALNSSPRPPKNKKMFTIFVLCHHLTF
jgi:hypothetical protein